MVWLLDTNAWIAYLNKKPSPIQSRILATSADELRLCDVVKAELYYGAYKSLKVTENLARLTNLFTLIPSLPFDGKATQHFGEIRTTLERQGTPIGAYDMLIAAIALANDCTLVTHNTREFSRIIALKLEDWEI
jgi:tRNA(fMet)-specific endonuclease VapC